MTAKIAKPKPTAAMVRAALRKRYSAPEYALFEEVRNGIGSQETRSADAVAVSLWPSRGVSIHGIEVKVQRADWLSELKNPRKADDIARFCHRWWLAVVDDSIVKDGELPQQWGLLILRGEVLVQAMEAPVMSPETPSPMFVAALLRRASQGIDKLLDDAAEESFARAQERVAAMHRIELERLQDERDDALKTLTDFEQASGMELSKWPGKELGERVKRFLELEHNYDPEPATRCRHAASFLEREAASLRNLSARLEQQRDIAQEHKDAP